MTRPKWLIFTFLGLTLIGLVIMGTMLACGYVPAEGFSNNGAHELRFGVVAGITLGFLAAAILEIGTYESSR